MSKVKLRNEFQHFEGGLFADAKKADVGDTYQRLEKEGVDMMAWADPFAPDNALPAHLLKAMREAMEQPLSAHYTAPIGNELLKQEIAKKIKRKNHLTIDPLRNILVTPGSDSGLYYAMLACLNPGDEVLIPTPTYANNLQNCEILQCRAKTILLKPENEYQIDIKDFENAVSEKTKLVVLTHPNNPTTTVFNQASLQALCNFIVAHDLLLVCDQAFEDFTFEHEFITPASLPGMWERTITVFSASKGMALSGFRVGYLVCCDEIMDALFGGAVSVLGATNTISQTTLIAAFQDTSFMDEYEAAFAYRRKKAFEILNEIPGARIQIPQSGFLGWLDIHQLGSSSEIVNYLIKEANVLVNDGSFYGPGGEGYIRIVLGVYRDNQRVVDALYRIQKALIKKACADSIYYFNV